MKIYPNDAVELMDMFPNEEACLDYLEMIRWPHGYLCLRCSEKGALKLSRGLYRCQSCKYEGSVIVDTLFQLDFGQIASSCDQRLNTLD
jgi:hypothetical protein